MPSKLKIWYLFSTKTALRPSQGDSIGESRIIKMLGQFADVYYNGELVDPSAETFGVEEKEIEIPTSGYDLYYVRANNEVFLQLPSPRICMAYPYNKEVFAAADGLVVTTNIWQRMFEDLSVREQMTHCFSRWYPQDAALTKPVIQYKQACDVSVSPTMVNQKSSDLWKQRLTNHTAIGFYGRLDRDSLPGSMVTGLEQASITYGADAPLLAFAGKIRAALKKDGGLPKHSIFLGEVPYYEMPNLLDATTYCTAGEGIDDLFLGSNKVLDAANLGCPVICKRNPVRDEYLGPSYSGLYDDEEQLKSIIENIMENRDFARGLHAQTQQVAVANQVEKAATSTQAAIEGFLS